MSHRSRSGMACSLSLSWAVPARRCAPRAGRAAAGLAPPRAGADDVFQCPDSSAEGFETGAPAAPAMEFCEVCSGEKSKCKHKNRPKNKVRRNGCGAFAVLCAAAPALWPRARPPPCYTFLTTPCGFGATCAALQGLPAALGSVFRIDEVAFQHRPGLWASGCRHSGQGDS